MDASATATGSRRSPSTGRPRRRRCSTPTARSTCSRTAATPLDREIIALLPTRRGQSPGRAAALPARDRHAHRGRAVRRDRRLRALREGPSTDELRRVGPLRSKTGQQRRQGAITKTGSPHARRLLVEAAWHYRAAPRDRQGAGRPPRRPARRALAVAWSAQQRLHRTWTRLEAARQAPHADRRRRRTRTRRLLLGGHPHPVSSPSPLPSRRPGRWRPGTARGTREEL